MKARQALSYGLCPTCQRAVPAASKERYCPNDGSRLLTACPHCKTPITYPYSNFCTACGEKLVQESMLSPPTVYAKHTVDTKQKAAKEKS